MSIKALRLAHGMYKALQRAPHQINIITVVLQHRHEEGHAAHAAKSKLSLQSGRQVHEHTRRGGVCVCVYVYVQILVILVCANAVHNVCRLCNNKAPA